MLSTVLNSVSESNGCCCYSVDFVPKEKGKKWFDCNKKYIRIERCNIQKMGDYSTPEAAGSTSRASRSLTPGANLRSFGQELLQVGHVVYTSIIFCVLRLGYRSESV